MLNWENTSLERKLSRYTSGIKNKIAKKLFKLYRSCDSLAINRHYYWQLRAAVEVNADLYIGHNLAALPVANAAAKIVKSRCGFDAEDFHRYEESDRDDDLSVILKKQIEEKYIPNVDHLSTASPLISQEYERLFDNIKPVTVLNLFPQFKPASSAHKRDGEAVKLFWFSQWIGRGRGLEEIMKAMATLPNLNIELHLLGEIFGVDKQFFDDMRVDLNIPAERIKFYTPIHPDKVLEFASQFDIGLATEISTPYNRDICLTNKLFTYIQSGLAVVASDTSAQTLFMKEFPSIGIIYNKKNHLDLASKLKDLINDPDDLVKRKASSLDISRSLLNWEIEENKIITSLEAQLSTEFDPACD